MIGQTRSWGLWYHSKQFWLKFLFLQISSNFSFLKFLFFICSQTSISREDRIQICISHSKTSKTWKGIPLYFFPSTKFFQFVASCPLCCIVWVILESFYGLEFKLKKKKKVFSYYFIGCRNLCYSLKEKQVIRAEEKVERGQMQTESYKEGYEHF